MTAISPIPSGPSLEGRVTRLRRKKGEKKGGKNERSRSHWGGFRFLFHLQPRSGCAKNPTKRGGSFDTMKPRITIRRVRGEGKKKKKKKHRLKAIFFFPPLAGTWIDRTWWRRFGQVAKAKRH